MSYNNEAIVSIIIVNWNGIHLIKDCVDSILRQTYNRYEVIIVDNGSSDGSVEFIRINYPFVKVIELNENRGFTGGNIAGLDSAVGNYIVLLNNDAVLSESWLEYMVSAMSDNVKIGLCSSKIIISGTDLIDSAGDVFTTAFTGTKIGEYQNEQLYSERRFVPGACAAAVIYRKSMLDEIGFLDEDFFLNHEDTDLNMRAWLAGWKCLFVPEALVYHKVSASIGFLSNTAVYYFSRNNLCVWIKNVPLRLMVIYLPQRILYELSSCIYFCFLKRKWRPFLKGKFDSLKLLPKMINKRKTVQRLVKLSDSEIKSDLMPIVHYLFRMSSNVVRGWTFSVMPTKK